MIAWLVCVLAHDTYERWGWTERVGGFKNMPRLAVRVTVTRCGVCRRTTVRFREDVLFKEDKP